MVYRRFTTGLQLQKIYFNVFQILTPSSLHDLQCLQLFGHIRLIKIKLQLRIRDRKPLNPSTVHKTKYQFSPVKKRKNELQTGQ